MAVGNFTFEICLNFTLLLIISLFFRSAVVTINGSVGGGIYAMAYR
jgi:hypothetical protein